MDTIQTCPVPHIPREQWRAHPKFSTQALLLRSHESFRMVNRILIERLEALMKAQDSTPWAKTRDLRACFDLYKRWIMSMRSHEGYEEHKLYPYLAHRFGISTEQLSAEHAELHDLDDTVRETYRLAVADPIGEGVLEALLRALRAHDASLDAHLFEEEDAVIPLLLSLTREEFARYYNGHVHDLLTDPVACAC